MKDSVSGVWMYFGGFVVAGFSFLLPPTLLRVRLVEQDSLSRLYSRGSSFNSYSF